MPAPVQAALINLGDSPLLSLIVFILVVGFLVWLWSYLVAPLLAQVVAEPFMGIVNKLVIVIAIVAVVVRVLEVIFGISVF